MPLAVESCLAGSRGLCSGGRKLSTQHLRSVGEGGAMNIKNIICVALGAALVATALPTFAQEQGPLEEIVVTSVKRSQTLQEIPVAVSVIQANDLKQSQVSDIKDLQFLVPSLRITQLQSSGSTNFVIRGFGNG